MLDIFVDAHALFSTRFFFNDTATTEIYTLSLHDALPIFGENADVGVQPDAVDRDRAGHGVLVEDDRPTARLRRRSGVVTRSEEHTSELQSHVNLVCRLLLEKKKNYSSVHQNRRLLADYSR